MATAQQMTDFESSRDTSPLKLEQLSDLEIKYILEIERCLAQAKDIPYPAHPLEHPLADVQDRYRRSLLLDGGRGTGKTSLLLTLVKRWHSATHREEWASKAEYSKVAHLGIRPTEIPAFIRVVRILDFDPLPPGMPILAGIIQALRPLVEQYDPTPQYDDESGDDEEERLVDLWRKLFRVAALGWSPIPNESGLIEQVLDREEQVRDWQQIAERWQSFVGKVLDSGRRSQGQYKLPDDTVFVIMIDDVDLQVARVQELLPALRVLYHPRVFFLVAADRLHMIDMLKLDFLGRQNELSRHGNSRDDDAIHIANTDRWAADLAHSAFQKVFPRKNQWKLERLSSLEFLAFPGSISSLPRQASEQPQGSAESGQQVEPAPPVIANFFANLRSIKKREQSRIADCPGDVGEFILHFARAAEEVKLPGVMPYRAAEQLRQYIHGVDGPSEVLARLLSQDTDERAAVAKRSQVGVDVSIVGELAALYRPWWTEYSGGYNLVLSDRPDFVFRGPTGKSLARMSAEPENGFNFTGALVAKMLEEADFPVNAAGLKWETYLSLAWTEWRFLGLSFAWTRHTHPRPDQLLLQTREWGKFIEKLIEPKNRLELCAYAWIYHQRRFSEDKVDEKIDPVKIISAGTALPWDKLLSFAGSRVETPNRWLNSTLPLLARPELGFPPNVQERLLDLLARSPEIETVKRDLKDERRRLVTDALVAAGVQRLDDDIPFPSDEKVEDLITAIDREYEKGNKKNWWAIRIESGAPAKKARVGKASGK